MTRDSMIELVQSWMEAGWQRGDPETLAPLHVPDFVDHSSAGRTPDLAGFLDGVVELYTAFPDFFATTDEIVIDEAAQRVTVSWSATGTHRDFFMEVPPTGRQIEFSGIEVLTVRDGRIAERWGDWNTLEILAQLERKSATPSTL